MGLAETIFDSRLLGLALWLPSLGAAWFATSVNRLLVGGFQSVMGWFVASVSGVLFAILGGLSVADMNGAGDRDAIVWGVPIGALVYTTILLLWNVRILIWSVLGQHPNPAVPQWVIPLLFFTPLLWFAALRFRRLLLWHLDARLWELEQDIDLLERLERDWFARRMLHWSRAWTTRRHEEIALITRHGLRARGPE